MMKGSFSYCSQFVFKPIFFVGLVIFFIACQKKDLKKGSKADALEIRIIHAAGDSYSEIMDQDTVNYLHYPFAIGELRNFEKENVICVAIAQDLQKRNKVKMKPIGALRYREFEIEKVAIILTSGDERNKFKGLDRFSDLIIRYKGMQKIIESWFLNKCGEGCAEYISWENEQYVDLILHE